MLDSVPHGEGYSLNQKVRVARQLGLPTITMHLKDAEQELTTRANMDKWLARLMDYAPEDVLEKMNKELFKDEETFVEHL